MRSRQPLHHNASMTSYETNKQLFDLVFMPILTRYTENDAIFHSIFDEWMLKEFMETIFGISKSTMTRVDEYKVNLEFSPYCSSEQYLIDICKVLNLIFRYFDFQTILNACPNQDIGRVNTFLLNCSKISKSPLLIEWAYYSLTSMFIRILNNIPTEGDFSVNMIKMIDDTSEQVLKLILHHGQSATFKALIHKSFRNLIQIIESINLQKSQTRVVDARLFEGAAY